MEYDSSWIVKLVCVYKLHENEYGIWKAYKEMDGVKLGLYMKNYISPATM